MGKIGGLNIFKNLISTKSPPPIPTNLADLFGGPIPYSLLNNFDHNYILIDKEAKIIYANEAFLQLCDFTDDEVNNQKFGEVFQCENALSPLANGCGDHKHCGFCPAHKAILGGITGKKTTTEVSLLRVDGSPKLLKLDVVPLHHEGEKFSFCCVEDISHKKNKELLDKIFFHDVKNILGAISGHAESLARELEDSPTLEAKAKELIHLSSSIEKELEFQHKVIEKGAEQTLLKKKTFLLGEFFRDLKFILDELGCLKGKELVYDVSHCQKIQMETDLEALQRVLVNLIKNAGESLSDKGRVTVKCFQEEEELRFTVHNPGVIPPEVMATLFRKSISTKGEKRGLGTFSVKILTEKYLQGRVEVESSSQKGTIFTVIIPRLQRPCNR